MTKNEQKFNCDNVEIRIWRSKDDPNDDLVLLMNASHLFEVTNEWLNHKMAWGTGGLAAVAYYEDRPIGLALLGCAPYCLAGQPTRLMWSLDNFVLEEFRGRGVYRKLLESLVQAANEEGTEWILTFPNSQSQPGFEHAGWKPLAPMWAHVRPVLTGGPFQKIRKVQKLIKSIRLPFKASPALSLSYADFDELAPNKPLEKEHLEFDSSSPALWWRFHPKRGTGYHVIRTDSYKAVVRLGYRGVLQEVQILATFPRHLDYLSMRKLIATIRETHDVDLITRISNEQLSMIQTLRTGFWKLKKITTPMLWNSRGLESQANPTLSGIDLHLW